MLYVELFREDVLYRELVRTPFKSQRTLHRESVLVVVQDIDSSVTVKINVVTVPHVGEDLNVEIFGDIKHELKVQFAGNKVVCALIIFIGCQRLCLALPVTVNECHETVVPCTAGCR